ncbi:MAG: tryptophan--tRNA ligase [Desulfurococcaceae archaeon TW002]
MPIVEFRIDPWSSEGLRDYEKLFTYFGVRPFNEVVRQLESFSPLPLPIRRGAVVGHRDFEKVLDALKNNLSFALLTGLMPSGKMHLGHKMVIDQVIYYQNLGAEVFLAIADVEAYGVRKLSREEVINLAINEYVANYLALGLETRKLHIYFQSNYRKEYYRLIQLFAKKVTMAELVAIYGENLEPAKMMAVLTQAADILHPELPHFGGFKTVLVPVGLDQDPHLRLTRDIADRFSDELGFTRPASTYHKFLSGLTGGKMSSSKPESFIALTDPINESVSKLLKAFTGGRATAEEQRKLGGEPDKCPVFELNQLHLVQEDKKLKKIYEDCRSGTILCGECKLATAERLRKFLEKHQEKLAENKEKAKTLVELPDF